MESNFSFLEHNYPEYYRLAVEAERNMMIAPRTAVMYARLTLEELIKWIYTYDEKLADKKPEKQTLEGLMYYAPFKALIADVPNLIDGLTLIRKNGNQALHNKNEVLLRYAHGSVHSLYEFSKWIYYTYVDSSVRLPLSLDTTLIPRESEAKETIASAKALEVRLKSVKEEAERQLQQKEEELKRLRAEVSRMKAENQRKSTRTFTLNPATESETREILIDVMLRELGWQPEGKNVREYPVQGMPTKSGKGRVDYVLWGDNGLPLAVVEVKRSMEDPRKGKQQAKCYADCLEKQFGRRPLIFYSNGYDTYFWDDTEYPPRQVAGFFSRDELEWTIAKRTKKPLQKAKVNEEIAGRYYQMEALKRVAETFDARHRKALLVMATGTGKTRTAIALVEMMLKQGWARRILFLADRAALVIQAKNNFVRLQPNLSCVDITKENVGAQTAKMIFSTYPTMMNKIDSERINDLLVYSPAHFDLVIIDEAHRSVYRKYQAIFSYFDALLVGLTATPKSEVDNELNKAVEDHYLVPPRRVEVTTRFLREGIKYNELSEEEKREYEERFYDEATGFMPEEIDPTALNDFVFNENTVDKVLNHLMTEGLKVEGGDKIGKTIIFAKNHKHAEFIVGRFYKLYPHFGGDFMQVIDNQQTYAQSLIDDFSYAGKMPQIAVSVDMLDTGIDIPEILNLVFFKIVRSSSKFWQMIGRGTRLCPGIFGLPADEKDTSVDKKEFLVFDYCQNFEFFDVHPEGIENGQLKSVSQRIMEARIRLAWHLQEMTHPDEQSEGLRNRLLDTVHRTVCGFNRNSFVVKAVLREVDIYSKREKWNTLLN